MSQKASASKRVPGTSRATRSTTSRQNSSGMARSKSALLMLYSAREGMAPPVPGMGNHKRWKCRLASVIAAAENYGRIGLLVVMILNLYLDPAVAGEVRSFKAVGRIRAVGTGHEPFRVVDDPAGIDAHVVGDHVAGQSYAVRIGPVTQVTVSRLSAQIVSNVVSVKGVS